MGLFSSLFGGGGAGGAASYQKAIDAIKSIATPELVDLQVQLDKYVQSGKLSPEAAESVLLNSNAFNNIKLDPSLRAAQKQALQQLQNIASQGGLTATDKAQLNDIAIEQNTVAKGRNEAIMQNAQERGIGGSGLELTSRLMNEQEAANRASTQGTQVAANAEQRALQALQAAGGLGGQMEAQQYGQEANKAGAQNAIDRFNAETQQATNMYNVGTANQAQAANLQLAQDVANRNTETAQKNKLYNSQQVQQEYANRANKAANLAGAYQKMGGAQDAAAMAAQGAEAGLIGGLVGTAGTVIGGMMGGPAGAAVGGSVGNMVGNSSGGSGTSNMTYGKNPSGFVPGMSTMEPSGSYTYTGSGWKPGMSSMEGYAEGGEVKDEDKMIEFPKDDMIEEHERLIPQLEGQEKEDQTKELAEIRDMTTGGFVPGKAKVKGDSPQNDVVPAMLSPGEVVIPRSAANDEEDFNKFMKEVKFQPMNCGGKAGYAAGGPVPTPKVPVAPPKPPPVMEPLPTETAPKAPIAPVAKDDTIERALKSLQFRVTNLEGGK